jgi:tetratricopeptide (TPR) repeat protein
MFCNHCGKESLGTGIYCAFCGREHSTNKTVQVEKDQGIALILSIIFGPVGLLYVSIRHGVFLIVSPIAITFIYAFLAYFWHKVGDHPNVSWFDGVSIGTILVFTLLTYPLSIYFSYSLLKKKKEEKFHKDYAHLIENEKPAYENEPYLSNAEIESVDNNVYVKTKEPTVGDELRDFDYSEIEKLSRENKIKISNKALGILVFIVVSIGCGLYFYMANSSLNLYAPWKKGTYEFSTDDSNQKPISSKLTNGLDIRLAKDGKIVVSGLKNNFVDTVVEGTFVDLEKAFPDEMVSSAVIFSDNCGMGSCPTEYSLIVPEGDTYKKYDIGAGAFKAEADIDYDRSLIDLRIKDIKVGVNELGDDVRSDLKFIKGYGFIDVRALPIYIKLLEEKLDFFGYEEARKVILDSIGSEEFKELREHTSHSAFGIISEYRLLENRYIFIDGCMEHDCGSQGIVFIDAVDNVILWAYGGEDYASSKYTYRAGGAEKLSAKQIEFYNNLFSYKDIKIGDYYLNISRDNSLGLVVRSGASSTGSQTNSKSELKQPITETEVSKPQLDDNTSKPETRQQNSGARTDVISLFKEMIINFDDSGILEKNKALLESFEKPSKGDRKAARSLNDKALDFLKNNDMAGAISALELATQKDPSDVEIVNNLASTYVRMNNPELAGRYALNALKINPSRTYAWDDLARSYAITKGGEDIASNCFVISYYFAKNKEKKLAVLMNPPDYELPEVKVAMYKAYDAIIRKQTLN